MRELYVAQSLGIDTTPFENPAFSYDQMHELLMGLREKLDVSVCANINFKSQHMSWIRHAMSRGTDTRKYEGFFLNTYYTMKWYTLLSDLDAIKDGKN